MPTTTTSRIGAINLVMVPSTDQDKSIEFYEGVLGFEKRTDIPFGGSYRWVEVYPPSGTAGIALAPPREGDPVSGRDTGISLTSDDIDATHAALKEAVSTWTPRCPAWATRCRRCSGSATRTATP